MRIGALMLLVSLAANPTYPARLEPGEAMGTPKALSCTFRIGTAANWEDGSPRQEPDSQKDPITFRDIDLATGKARVVGNAGENEVELVVGPTGMTFIETTRAGSFIATTVFTSWAGDSTRDFIAVHSRHIPAWKPITPVPMPSQLHGTCRVLAW